MTLDPIDPGSDAGLDDVAHQAAGAEAGGGDEEHLAKQRLDSVRLEQPTSGYMRAVLIGPDGDPVEEHLLFPV